MGLGLNFSDKFITFPVALLDEVAVIWTSERGHNVSRKSKHLGFIPIFHACLTFKSCDCLVFSFPRRSFPSPRVSSPQ